MDKRQLIIGIAGTIGLIGIGIVLSFIGMQQDINKLEAEKTNLLSGTQYLSGSLSNCKTKLEYLKTKDADYQVMIDLGKEFKQVQTKLDNKYSF